MSSVDQLVSRFNILIRIIKIDHLILSPVPAEIADIQEIETRQDLKVKYLLEPSQVDDYHIQQPLPCDKLCEFAEKITPVLTIFKRIAHFYFSEGNGLSSEDTLKVFYPVFDILPEVMMLVAGSESILNDLFSDLFKSIL